MIWSEGFEYQNLSIDGLYVDTAYLDGELIYVGIKSCYGKGYWRPSKPWLDNEKWKDN